MSRLCLNCLGIVIINSGILATEEIRSANKALRVSKHLMIVYDTVGSYREGLTVRIYKAVLRPILDIRTTLLLETADIKTL